MDVDIRKWQYCQRGLGPKSLRLAVSKIAMEMRAKNSRIFMILVDCAEVSLKTLPLTTKLKTEMDKIMITV